MIVGDTPADVAKSYADLTGYAPRMPAWASGFWQCRLRYEDQEELLEVAREYKRRGIPVAAIVIDYFHWTEQGEWKFDPTYWPDPEGMCRELKAMGIQPIVSIWPTINPNSENYTTWQALRQSVISGLSMAVCGIPWWNSDIGGFCGGDTQSEYFRELIVRWFQFGLFCPIMRLHGARLRIPNAPVRNPGIIEPTGGPNEIWQFGNRAYGIIEKLIQLRERLRPYIHAQLEVTSKTGMPLMRPMFYAFPDDAKCYELDDQYMFGSDILFAPIMEGGQTERWVYLPAGQWVRTTDG